MTKKKDTLQDHNEPRRDAKLDNEEELAFTFEQAQQALPPLHLFQITRVTGEKQSIAAHKIEYASGALWFYETTVALDINRKPYLQQHLCFALASGQWIDITDCGAAVSSHTTSQTTH